jgi:RNase P subunit RPR2
MALEVIADGITQEIKKAKRLHLCKKCPARIEPGQQYYARYYGSGLEAQIFYDDLCLECGKKKEPD